MARLVAKNDAVTTLATDVAVGDLHIHVAAGTGALFGASGDWMMRLGTSRTSGEYEYVRATAITGDQITVTRAQAGTSAIAHTSGTKVWSVIDATVYDELWTAIDLCFLTSNLDNTAGGTDEATTKAPTSNVLYDLARDVLAYDTTPVLRGDLNVATFALSSSGAIGLKPSGDVTALITFSTVSTSPTLTVTGILNVLATGAIQLKPDSDNDNFVEFTTVSNIPIIKTAGAFTIASDGATIDLKPSGDVDNYFSFSTVTDAPTLTAIGALNLVSSAAISLKPSGDTDNYISITTVSNAPTITSVGALNIVGDSSVTFKLSGDVDNYISLTTVSNAPTITSVGVLNLVSDGAINLKPSGDTDSYITFTTVTDVPTVTVVGALNVVTSGSITFKTSEDTDDYITIATLTNVPTIYGTGAYLRIGDNAFSSHSLASDDDFMVTGKFECDGTGYFDGSVEVTGGITVSANIVMDGGTDTISGKAATGGTIAIQVQDTGVGRVEVLRFVGAADPYVRIGRDDTGLATNAVTDELMLYARAGSTNVAAGFGLGIPIYLSNDAHECEERASIDFILTTATNGSEVAKVTFNLAGGAGVAEALTLTYDGTVSSLIPQTGKYLRIGDAGTTSHTFNTNDDLFVSGRLEVDGLIYCDGALTIGNSLYMGTGQYIYAGNSDGNYYINAARDSGVGLVEVSRVQGAADPYVMVGRDDTGVATNAITDGLVLQMGSGSSNSAANSGFGLSVWLGNDASEVEERCSIDFSTVTATNGNEQAKIVFNTANAGTVAGRVHIDYGGLTFYTAHGISCVSADDNYWFMKARDNGVGLVEIGRGQSGADPYVRFGRDDSGVSTSAVTDGLVLQMACGANNSSAGQGFGISILLGNAASETEERASIDTYLVTATNGAEDVSIAFNLMDGGAMGLVFTINGADKSLTADAGHLTFSASEDSAAVADEVSICGFDISAGHRAFALSCEEVVVAETDETKFSHKLPVRINGATYNIMLCET